MTLYPVRYVAALALLLVLTGGVFGFTTLAQDLAYTRVQTELSFWGRGDYHPRPQAVLDTEQSLRVLLQKSPQHPEFLSLLARYNAWQAYWSEDMRRREVFSRAAMNAQYHALESRPAHRHSWPTMVEYASHVRDGDTLLRFAQTRLKLLQPPASPVGFVQGESR